MLAETGLAQDDCMVQAARESQIAETNAASQIDVFGMTDDAGKKENTDPADVDVF